jgi:uncharacterized membrane protein
MDKITLTIGIVLLIAGISFTFLPHDAHNTILGFVVHEHSGADAHQHEHGSHDLHIKFGYGVAIAGFLLTIYGIKKK